MCCIAPPNCYHVSVLPYYHPKSLQKPKNTEQKFNIQTQIRVNEEQRTEKSCWFIFKCGLIMGTTTKYLSSSYSSRAGVHWIYGYFFLAFRQTRMTFIFFRYFLCCFCRLFCYSEWKTTKYRIKILPTFCWCALQWWVSNMSSEYVW